MNTIEALNSRYSCRNFKSDPVPEETILKILEAAIRAPSWANSQPWEIYVASGEHLDRLRKEYLKSTQEGKTRNPDLAVPQEWPAYLQKRIEERMKNRPPVSANEPPPGLSENFYNAPAIVFLCMDKTLTSWSVFDLGMLAQSILLAARDCGVDSIPAARFVAYPDLIRGELGIPDEMSVVAGIAIGYAVQPRKLNSPRRPVSEVVHL
jgi:nitroreductase